MTKNVFFLMAIAVLMSMQSCMSDGCSFDGKWTVQSADVQSAKLSPSIVQMTKDDYMTSVYEFAKDGKVSVTGAPGAQVREGTWAFDENTQVITMKNRDDSQVIWAEQFQMAECGGGEMTLMQRIPSDTTREAVAEVTLIIKKAD